MNARLRRLAQLGVTENPVCPAAWRGIAWRYGFALAMVAAGVALRWWLEQAVGELPPFITLYPAVLAVALVAGMVPGVLAALLSAGLVNYLFMPPVGSFSLPAITDQIAIGIFLMTNLAIAIAAEKLSTAQRHRTELQQMTALVATLDNVGEGVILANPEGKVVFMNAVAQTTLGSADHDVMPMLSDVLRVASNENLAAAPQHDLSSRSAARTLLLHTYDGREIPVELVEAEIRAGGTDDARPHGKVVIFRDVSERYVAENDRQQLLEALQQEKEWLSLVLNSITDEVYFTDLGGQYHLVNTVALNEFKRSAMHGMPVLEAIRDLVVLRPDGTPRPTSEAPPLRALAGETIKDEEQIVLTPRTGEMRHRQVSSSPVRDANGNIIGSVSVVSDITERKRFEAAIQASEARFRAMFDDASRPISLTLPDGRFAKVNRAYCDMLGYSEAELLATDFLSLTHPDDVDTSDAAWHQLLAREVPSIRLEKRYLHKDGHAIWCDSSVAIVHGPDGAVEGFITQTHDITARKQAEINEQRALSRLQNVLYSITDGMAMIDREWRYLFINPQGAKIVGRSPEQLIGVRVLDAFPDWKDTNFYRAASEALATQSTRHFEEHSPMPGNRWLECHCYPSDEGLTIYFRDITSKKVAEQHLKDRERQFVGLANAIPQLAYTEDAAGRPQYFNRGWYAYTGLSETLSLDGHVWKRVLHPDDEAATSDRWKRSIQTGAPYEAEFRLRRDDGEFRWFLARAVPDIDAAGHVVQWFGTCTDIDEVKRIEENLRVTETALREADRRKDVFIATLSHELRNPLAPIRTSARLLDMPNVDTKDLARCRSIISRQVSHMATLLDDLLDVSRLNRGMLALKKDYVPLQRLLDAAVETAQPLIAERRHRLELDAPAEPVVLDVDPVRLTQVISNLLTNAAKYTPDGGLITLGARRVADALHIFVRDTGIGMAREDMVPIFDMFAQVKRGDGHVEGGLGIGLALAKAIVELHGGSIAAHSDGRGKGSTLTVTLPGSLVVSKGVGSPASPGETIAAAGRARRVLIADDNKDGAESLAMLINLLGHETHVVYSGAAALDAAANLRPDIAVLDIGMPELNGYEVAERIRATAWGRNIMLVALTGWGTEEDKQKARSAGFDHHLTKPTDIAELEKLFDAASAMA